MKIKAIIHPAEESGYWAEVPALPGCITEGDTMEEVLTNLKDAIKGWLEVANSTHSLESNTQLDFSFNSKSKILKPCISSLRII
jgi:predicted RNase H-like HicB family nuclease